MVYANLREISRSFREKRAFFLGWSVNTLLYLRPSPGGVPVPLFPRNINRFVRLFPKIALLIYYVPHGPQNCLSSLVILILCLCSLVPLIFRLLIPFPKTPWVKCVNLVSPKNRCFFFLLTHQNIGFDGWLFGQNVNLLLALPTYIILSCVPTSKVSVPHFAHLAVFVDRFMWDYNGKPLSGTGGFYFY